MLGLSVIAAVAVVGASWAAMNGALDNQQARNQRLQGEIKEMDQKIKEIEDLERVKSNLLARMRVIENMQAKDRKSVVLGKSVSVRVDLGGRRNVKKHNNQGHTDSI